MKPANVFQLEMASLFAGPRTLFVKLGFSFLVGIPLVVVDVPLSMQVTGMTMLLVFISFFGAAVGFVRRRTDGHITRLRLLPIPKWIVLGDFLLADALVDLMQISPILLLFIFLRSTGITFHMLMITFLLLTATVFILNLAGMVLGSMAKSNPEVHLFGGLAAGMIVLVSGLAPVPGILRGFVEAIRPWNPLSSLKQSLSALGEGMPVVGSAWEAILMALLFLAAIGLFLFRAIDWHEMFPAESPSGDGKCGRTSS